MVVEHYRRFKDGTLKLKETLAVMWGILHFRFYLSDFTFTVWTDHKPQVSILSKPRFSPSARINRLLLKLLKYSFTAKHKAGSENAADYLSRHPIPLLDQTATAKDIEGYANFVVGS